MKGFSEGRQDQGCPKNKALFVLVAVILVSAWTLLSSIDLIDFNLHRNSSDSIALHEQDLSTLPSSHHQPPLGHGNNNDISNNNLNDSPALNPTPLEPATTFLDPNTKYFSFMPFGGLTNQFMAVQTATYIAFKLNRTLLLPPIISNSHDHKNTHQRWSQYMDLPKLTTLTGIRVLEWEQVRPLSSAQRQVGLDQALTSTHLVGPYHSETEEWASVAENITCQIVCGYGRPDLDINFSAQNFMFHFLLRPVYVDPLPPKAGARTFDYDNKIPGALVLVEDLLDRYSDFDDRLPEEIARGKPNMLFLSNTFKVKSAEYGGIFWKVVGQHIHFEPKMMEYATLRINEEIQADRNIEILPNDDLEEVETTEDERQNPISEDGTTVTNIQAPPTRIPYIAVHLRRGDIWQKCRDRAIESCVLPMEHYVDAVERAREYASKSLGLLSHLPVIVTTDTTSEDDIQKIEELGWHRLDHAKYGTTEVWGTFGPAMVDSAILAHADVLVGSEASTMSRIAGLRQRGWYNRKSFFPKYDSAKMKSRRRETVRRRLEKE
ncbi:hypothetical protein BGZ95_000375 [Linnemannia exigua]|uniref:GDP-fucose protein O-fucosyltransferase 2 n=1 Tax=Linnemannia exigua TaxID=604196 RepID=A0AAD4D8N5_9FUNG|nr:hypothetical protein BGZ95_000375 [Linnemannia exigua]